MLELATLATAKGLHFLDCPVAGRPDVAEARALAVFAGGAVDDVAAARPVLEPINKSVTHFGATGSGKVYRVKAWRGHHLEIKPSRRTRRYAGKAMLDRSSKNAVKRMLPYL